MDEKKPARKASQNGKYDLLLYLLEQNAQQPESIKLEPFDMIDKIRRLTHQEALELFPRDNRELMEKLMTYVKQNRVKIKESGLFFPGRKHEMVSERSLLHELHFFLKGNEEGKSLKDFGLRIRQERTKKVEDQKPKDVIDWAKELLK